MSNLIRSIILGFAALASLALTGCGTLTIGGEPVYATKKQDLGGSDYNTSTRGPGYKSDTNQSTSRLGYYLGTGSTRVYCLYDQGHSSSTVRNSSGKTVHQSSQHNRNCSAAPEPVIKPPVMETPVAKLLTPTPKDATCGDFSKGDSAGRLIRDCYTRAEPAAGRLSCITGWEEVWVAGKLQVTGIDSAVPNCTPKVAPAPTAAPAAAPVQQPRPSFGRKVPA